MIMENNGASILPDYSFRSSMFPAVGDPINIFLPTIRSYLAISPSASALITP